MTHQGNPAPTQNTITGNKGLRAVVGNNPVLDALERAQQNHKPRKPGEDIQRINHWLGLLEAANPSTTKVAFINLPQSDAAKEETRQWKKSPASRTATITALDGLLIGAVGVAIMWVLSPEPTTFHWFLCAALILGAVTLMVSGVMKHQNREGRILIQEEADTLYDKAQKYLVAKRGADYALADTIWGDLKTDLGRIYDVPVDKLVTESELESQQARADAAELREEYLRPVK